MSKAALKKAEAELRGHLRRDIRGVQLLDKVARAANDIRKTSAERLERAEKAEATIEPIRDELEQTKRELDRCRRELEQAQDRQRQAESRTMIAEQKLDELRETTPLGDATSRITAHGLTGCNRALYHAFQGPAPPPIRARSGTFKNAKVVLLEYELNQVLLALNDHGFAMLGRFIMSATMATKPGVVISITSESNTDDVLEKLQDEEQKERVAFYEGRFWQAIVQLKSRTERLGAHFGIPAAVGRFDRLSSVKQRPQ